MLCTNAVFILLEVRYLSKLKTNLSKIISHFYTDNVVLTITNKRYSNLK